MACRYHLGVGGAKVPEGTCRLLWRQVVALEMVTHVVEPRPCRAAGGGGASEEFSALPGRSPCR